MPRKGKNVKWPEWRQIKNKPKTKDPDQMIDHLNGRMVEKHPTHLVVECAGVGYFAGEGRLAYPLWFCG